VPPWAVHILLEDIRTLVAHPLAASAATNVIPTISPRFVISLLL
jgi:hypothetical protein